MLIEKLGSCLNNHITKYISDIINIHNQLAKIKVDAVNIQKKSDDIKDIVVEMKDIMERPRN